jgi:drug/metabolite transporter (DMT)-like permease
MLQGFVSLILAQIFGNSVVPIGTKIASPFTGPIIFVFFRFLIASIILYVIFNLTERKKIKKQDYKDFALLGFLLMINIILFTFGIGYTTVIMSTLIYSMTPILVGIIAHYTLQESFTKQKLLGLIISFIGILLLLNQSFSGMQSNIFGEPLGNILICIATIGYSYYIIYSRRVLHKKNNNPVQTTFLTFIFCLLFICAILIITILFGFTQFKPLPSEGIWGFIVVGLGSVVQYSCLQIGIKRTSAFTASIFQYTGPFIAAAVAIPFLHEQITVQLVFGGLLILFGVFIATTYKQLSSIFVKN